MKQNFSELKEEIKRCTIFAEDYVIDGANGKKIREVTGNFKYTIKQLCLIDLFRVLYPTAIEFIFF